MFGVVADIGCWLILFDGSDRVVNGSKWHTECLLTLCLPCWLTTCLIVVGPLLTVFDMLTVLALIV